MDKDVTQVLEGVGAAKLAQYVLRAWVDKFAAENWLYSAEQYVKDLKAAQSDGTPGYAVQPVDAAKTDAEIGAIVMQDSGYTFISGPGNLRGSAKLTADPFTFQAAAGQKVAAWKMPSTWLSAAVGALGVEESMYNSIGLAGENKKYKLLIAAAGASLLGDGVCRGLKIDGAIAAPSGFDVSKQPIYQYLDNKNSLQTIQSLSAQNNELRQQLIAVRSAQPPRGIPDGIGSYNASMPIVQVSEIIPGKGAEYIKERANLMGGIQKATPEAVKHRTGLVTLTGGR